MKFLDIFSIIVRILSSIVDILGADEMRTSDNQA